MSDTVDGPGLLLIERARSLRTHAGQVAFPGGAVDPGDVDPPATALREAHEEVGLDPATVVVAATLPSLYPTSVGLHRASGAGLVGPAPSGSGGRRGRGGRGGHRPGCGARRTGESVPGDAPVRVRRAGLRRRWTVRLGVHRGAHRRVVTLGGWTREWDRGALRPIPMPSETLGTFEP